MSFKIYQKDIAKPDKIIENDVYICPECQSKRENNVKASNDSPSEEKKSVLYNTYSMNL